MSLGITLAMAIGLAMASAAPASPSLGGNENPEHVKTKQHPAVDRLVLSPAQASIRAGSSLAYFARGYDAAGHDLGDVTAYTRFSMSPDGSCTGATCLASKGGPHTVTATIPRANRAISAKAALQVVIPPRPAQSSPRTSKPSPSAALPTDGVTPDRAAVQLRQGIQHQGGPVKARRHDGARPRSAARLVLSPARTFIVSGERVAYAAEAFDAAGRSLGDVTARTTFSITFSARSGSRARPDGSCAGAVCTAEKLGRHTVTGIADLGTSTLSGTAAVQVVPHHRRAGPLPWLASIELYPKSAAIESGDSLTYIAFGYDSDHRRLGDVTDFTVFSISPDGSCDGPSCTAVATAPRMHTVTGTLRLRQHQLTATATLLVMPKVAALHLEPATAKVEVRHGVDYTAYGVDADGHRVADLTDYTRFTTSPPGSCTRFTCGSAEEGTYVVTGALTIGERTIRDQARLQVIPVISELRLSPESGSTKAGVTVSYRAEGLDRAGRAVLDLTADTVFSIGEPGSCKGDTCMATKAQDYTVTGTVQLVDRIIHGSTTLHVEPGAPALLILDQPQATITAGEGRAYRASAWDAFGNPLGEVTAGTSFAITPDGSCHGATCTATSARPSRHTVTGTIDVGSQPVSGTAILDVLAGPLARLTLDHGQATIAAGEGQTYRAYGADAYGNPLGEITSKTTFTISPDGSCTRATCTATSARPARHIVTATVDSVDRPVSTTAILDVIPGALATLVLDQPRAVITAGDGQPYRAYGSDAYGNPLGEVTAKTTFGISPDGSCTGATCTASNPGEHIVTGTADLGKALITGQARLLVVATSVVSLRLNPRSAVTYPDAKVTYTATGVDGADRAVVDLTDYTSFSITKHGSCRAATCTARALGDYTVTGSVASLKGIAGGDAALQVIARHQGTLPPQGLASLVLDPKSAEIDAGAPMVYTAIGVDGNGTPLRDVTADTSFTISPDGSCTHARCTADTPGPHTVSGTLVGSVTDGATVARWRTDGPALSAKPSRRVTGSATLQVSPAPSCMASLSEVRILRLTPQRGPRGTSVRIGGKVDRRFAACRLVLLLDGIRFGAGTTVGVDGSISGSGTVSGPANRRSSTVTLATVDGRAVAASSFDFTSVPGSPRPPWPTWLLFAIAILVLGAAAGLRERERQQRRWVQQHVRTEAHSSPGQAHAEPDTDAPTFSVRLQPQTDTGTTEITKEGSR